MWESAITVIGTIFSFVVIVISLFFCFKAFDKEFDEDLEEKQVTAVERKEKE